MNGDSEAATLLGRMFELIAALEAAGAGPPAQKDGDAGSTDHTLDEHDLAILRAKVRFIILYQFFASINVLI